MEYFAEMILIIHLMCVVNFFLIHLKNLFGFKENIPVDLENKTQYPCFNERKWNDKPNQREGAM